MSFDRFYVEFLAGEIIVHSFLRQSLKMITIYLVCGQ